MHLKAEFDENSLLCYGDMDWYWYDAQTLDLVIGILKELFLFNKNHLYMCTMLYIDWSSSDESDENDAFTSFQSRFALKMSIWAFNTWWCIADGSLVLINLVCVSLWITRSISTKNFRSKSWGCYLLIKTHWQ